MAGIAMTAGEGMAKAEAGANEEWKEAALDAIRQVCEDHETFHVDDVWGRFINLYGEEFALNGTRVRAAMGPMIKKADKQGWCERTEFFIREAKVKGRNNHRPNVLPIWRSLLYKEQVQVADGGRDGKRLVEHYGM